MKNDTPHIVNEPQPDYEKAELDLLRDGLKRTHKERFSFLMTLMKIQAILQKTKITKKPFTQDFIGNFEDEVLHLWAALNKNEVRYILSGDVAACFYGCQHLTGAFDIWVEDTLINRKMLRKSFAHCGLGDFEPLEKMPFVPGWTYFNLNNGIRLDLMDKMKGLQVYLSFDECYHLASIADIEGIKVPFLHLNHLLSNKKAVNRPKRSIRCYLLGKNKKVKRRRRGQFKSILIRFFSPSPLSLPQISDIV